MVSVTLEGLHTYYVGPGLGTLVHNCGGMAYEANNGKHKPTQGNSKRGAVSTEPIDGPGALKNSVPVDPAKPNSVRIWVDVANKQVVVLRPTNVQAPCGCATPGGSNAVYHGYAPDMNDLNNSLSAAQRSALVNMGWAEPSGNFRINWNAVPKPLP
jgi:hypothetical protein